MSIQVDPPAHRVRPRSSGLLSSGSLFAWAAVFRVLGALLCLAGAMAMVITELLTWRQTWLQLTTAERAGQCAAWAGLSSPLSWVREGPHQDLWLAPAVLALLVIGVRVLIGKGPAIPPTLTALLLIVGAFLTYYDRFMRHYDLAEPPFSPEVPCATSQTGSLEPLFFVGFLAALLGCMILSRTTRYRPLGLHDA